jgi:glutathione S-transferase
MVNHTHTETNSLFLHDAGIDFEDKRYPFNDTWKATSKELQEKGISKTGRVPVLEYKGVFLAQVSTSSPSHA